VCVDPEENACGYDTKVFYRVSVNQQCQSTEDNMQHQAQPNFSNPKWWTTVIQKIVKLPYLGNGLTDLHETLQGDWEMHIDPL